MSSEVCIVPSHRLRVLNGPLQGAKFGISGHLTIGRSCESDVQVLQDGTSRNHAQVFAMPGGRHRVVDLHSANGTFVDDRRIRECVLEPGMVVRIGLTRFVYEPVPHGEPARSDVEEIMLRRVGGEGLRTLHGSEHESSAVDTSGSTPGSEREGSSADLLAPAPATEGKDLARPRADGLDVRDRLMATLPDGSRYAGDLLDDVVAYRSLRTKKLRGDELERGDDVRFQTLDAQLRPPPDRSGFRQYHRYGCHIPAFIRLLAGRTLPVVVENIGVDGAKVCVPWHRLATNTIAWLAIDVVRNRQSSILVFSGRVVWWECEHLGMSFSGSPGWARRGGRESLMPTQTETERGMPSRTSNSRPLGSAEPTQWLEAEDPLER